MCALMNVRTNTHLKYFFLNVERKKSIYYFYNDSSCCVFGVFAQDYKEKKCFAFI